MVFRILVTSCIILIAQNVFSQESLSDDFKIKTTPREITGSELSEKNSDYINPDQKIIYAVYPPNDFNPSAKTGIMVFAGAYKDNHPTFNWLSSVRESNLIYIEALVSDVDSSFRQRQILAEMAVPLLEKRYNIDENRIYISGEGRVASVVAMNNPGIFKGAIYTNGNLWTENAETKLDSIKQNKFVFITGDLKSRAKQARDVYGKYKKAGIENSKLIFLNPVRSSKIKRIDLVRAINYLDDPDSSSK